MLTEVTPDAPAALELVSAAARGCQLYDVVLLDMCDVSGWICLAAGGWVAFVGLCGALTLDSGE